MRRTALALAITMPACIAQTSLAQTLGSNCGRTAPPVNIVIDPSPNPPNIWAYPNCKQREYTLECQPSTNGFFAFLYRPSGGGAYDWRGTCCQPNTTPQTRFWYDDDGNFIGWNLCCNVQAETCVPFF